MEEVTRRAFLKASLAAAGGGGVAAQQVAGRRQVAPSAKVTIGIVGVAGRGFGYHQRIFGAMPDVQIGAVCDVYDTHLQRAVAATGGRAKAHRDFRKLVEQEDLDAVIVATPPHWHTLVALHAMQAGKDVLVEKPMCRYPAEGRALVEFARRHGRVTQVGTQIHATENYRRCVNLVRSGVLGKISSVSTYTTMNDNSEELGHPENSSPPAGLDWETWLGPAPETPFNIGRFRDGMHRYFKDYVDSWLHELGPHIVDLPWWALELGQPAATVASGGRYATDSMADVPDTMNAIWEFPNLTVTWDMLQHNAFHFGVGAPGPKRHNGIIFHGKEATLAIVNYGVPVVLDRAGKEIAGLQVPEVVGPSPGHEREFIDAVRSRKECSCSVASHLPMHVAMNLAHISLKTGEKIRWDAEKFAIKGDRRLRELANPDYRPPWKLPT